MCTNAFRLVSYRFLVAILLFIVLPVPAAAQDTGIISGTVVDSSGQTVPGAAVTPLTYRAVEGTLTFRAVQPGTYAVSIELSALR